MQDGRLWPCQPIVATQWGLNMGGQMEQTQHEAGKAASKLPHAFTHNHQDFAAQTCMLVSVFKQSWQPCLHLCVLFMHKRQVQCVLACVCACVCALAAKQGEQEEARWLEGLFIYSLPNGLGGFRGTWQHLSWAL